MAINLDAAVDVDISQISCDRMSEMGCLRSVSRFLSRISPMGLELTGILPFKGPGVSQPGNPLGTGKNGQ